MCYAHSYRSFPLGHDSWDSSSVYKLKTLLYPDSYVCSIHSAHQQLKDKKPTRKKVWFWEAKHLHSQVFFVFVFGVLFCLYFLLLLLFFEVLLLLLLLFQGRNCGIHFQNAAFDWPNFGLQINILGHVSSTRDLSYYLKQCLWCFLKHHRYHRSKIWRNTRLIKPVISKHDHCPQVLSSLVQLPFIVSISFYIVIVSPWLRKPLTILGTVTKDVYFPTPNGFF